MSRTRAARLVPEDWLDAGLAALRAGGVAAVRVERLAAGLRATRGSFYWHFADRDALLRALLDHWQRRQTERIIDAVEAGGGSAAARLLRLLLECARDDGLLEIALRSWAAFDRAASDAVAAADRRRTDYLVALLREHGIDAEEAARRARMAYAAWLGTATQRRAADDAQATGDMRSLHAMLLAAEPTDTQGDGVRADRAGGG